MLSKKIEEAINAQINAELWSAYLYMSMAAYCHAKGNPGMGKWFEVQFQEEQDHAKVFFNYIISRGGNVTLTPIKAVPTTWDSILDVFESTLAHERSVTGLINKLFALTTAEHAQMVHRRAGGGGRDRTDHHRQPEDDKGQRLRTLYA